jgi:hypothetical protein
MDDAHRLQHRRKTALAVDKVVIYIADKESA